MCRKPLVTIRPTSAPRRSRTAFVATVVPWRIASRSGKETLARSAASLMPSITPTDWSPGVLGVFASQTRWSPLS